MLVLVFKSQIYPILLLQNLLNDVNLSFEIYIKFFLYA
jgi:hypothetical protein